MSLDIFQTSGNLMSNINPKIASILRSLRHRNYRLFFSGQLASLIGTWITTTATSWLMYRLTSSASLLAALNVAAMVPSVVLTPIAGVQIDRWDRRKILLVTQSISMLQSFALAAFTLSDAITVPILFFLVVVQGLANSYDMPARQAFVAEIIESKQDLTNAISLNSAMFNSARLIGPAIGGIIIASAGEGYCFLLDGFSYIAVIFALRAIRPVSSPVASNVKQPFLTDIREGLDYVFRFAPLRWLILIVAATSFGATPYSVLMPAFARDSLHSGADTMGLLMASSGLGALSAAIYLASRRTVLGLGKVIAGAGVLLGSSLMTLATLQSVGSSIFVLALIGCSTILLLSSSNSLIQTLTDPEKRGRVMSFYIVAFTGAVPFGSAFAGWGADIAGARWTIAAGGAFILVITLRFALKLPDLRRAAKPILIDRGILPTP